MPSTPHSREALLVELIGIPGVTASPEEDSAARFIHDRLASLPWFGEHPECLTLLPTPLEGDARPLHTVVALVRARRDTRRTIILTGHYDVVDTAVYGTLREQAFDPAALAENLDPAALDGRAAADLASGGYLFGRGSMDMKCGLAVEMELLRDFSENRDRYDVNLLFVAVPDEENASAGMRGAAPYLAELQRTGGLEFLAAVNAEPTEAGRPSARNPAVFLGTVGKLMPVFLCLGRESHVGAYYGGLSAALLSSRIHVLAEGSPELADPVGGECCPSWICLEHKILRSGYSVTVPGASVIYFNCYATSRTPAEVLAQMRRVAERAGAETVEQLKRSRSALLELGLPVDAAPEWQVHVLSADELRRRAAERLGPDVLAEQLRIFAEKQEGDLRDASIAVLRQTALLAGEEGPLVIVGFLPPYYPPRSSLVRGARHEALARAAADVIDEADRRYGIVVEQAAFFTGLCDLSYFGFQGRPEELAALENNLPGWGDLYTVPTAALAELDVPVINFGPSGHDAHKKTERLEKRYSLEQYPELLDCLVRAVARENAGADSPER